MSWQYILIGNTYKFIKYFYGRNKNVLGYMSFHAY